MTSREPTPSEGSTEPEEKEEPGMSIEEARALLEGMPVEVEEEV